MNKLFSKHEIRYMDSVFGEFPRKYDVGEIDGIFFRHKKEGIRCAMINPSSTIFKPDHVKEFSGDHKEWIYKLT